MSFEVFIQAFVAGESVTLPLDRIESILGASVAIREDALWCVSDGEGGLVDFYIGAESLMVSRPTQAAALWNSLYRILAATDGVLFWPGEKGSAVVASIDVMTQLPATFVAAVGMPRLVGSGEEITRLIANEK